MALATLSIDLEARLAGLQAGMDKAGVLAEKTAQRINGQFDGLNTVFKGLGVTLAASLSAAGLTAFFRATTDGLDQLNDLADATGASVENLSALEDIALRTGGSMESAGDAVIKLNKALADAKPGSDQAAAFTALGLSVEELKRIDPVEAFQRLAVALQGYEDDAQKARIVQELFGKSLKEVAPLLKDMAEAGKLNATVTTAQAQAAEAFNKQLFNLQKNAVDAAREISGPLISALNSMAEAFKQAAREGRDISAVLGDKLAESFGVNIAERDAKRLREELGRIDALLQNGTLMTQRRTDLEAKRLEIAQQLKSIEPLAIAGSNPASYSNEGRNYPTMRRPSLPDLPTAAGKAGKAGPSAAYPVDTLAVYQADQLREALEAIDKINRDWQPATFINAGELFEAELLRKAFEEIEEVNKRADQELSKAAKGAKDTGDDVGKDLGLVFSSAAGEAIRNFESLRSVLKGVLADIQQIVLKKTLTDPLGKLITDQLGGFTLPSLFSLFSANGNAFDRGGALAFANGGVVNAATPFKFGGGRLGVMGEAGPEGILPLARGRDGKLGVRSQGGAGVSVNYSPVINIDSRTDQAAIAQTVAQAVQAGQQQLMQQLKDSGAL